jgi:hypothetical protein
MTVVQKHKGVCEKFWEVWGCSFVTELLYSEYIGLIPSTAKQTTKKGQGNEGRSFHNILTKAMFFLERSYYA